MDKEKYEPRTEITIYADSGFRVWTKDASVAARLTRYLGPPTDVHNGGLIMWRGDTQNGISAANLGMLASLTHGWFDPPEGVPPPCRECGREWR